MLRETNYPTAKSINLSTPGFLPLIGTEEGGRSWWRNRPSNGLKLSKASTREPDLEPLGRLAARLSFRYPLKVKHPRLKHVVQRSSTSTGVFDLEQQGVN